MQRMGIIALALSACSGGESWLRLDLSLATGMPQPASLAVWVPVRQVVPLDGKALPGSLIVRHLAGSSVSLEVDGLDASGAVTSQVFASIPLRSGENDSALTLGPPGDGGPDLAYNALCPSDAIFCDGFESGDISKWNTSSSKPAGVASFVIDNVHARGNYAFDGHSAMSSGSTFALVEELVTLASPSLVSGRFYVYAESYPGGYANFLGLFGGASMTDGYSVGVDSSGNWVVPQDQAASPDLHSSVAMTYNSWHCVELIVDYAANKVELDVDGAIAINATPAKLTVPTDILAGLIRAPGNQTTRIWFDDFALALHRIGCE